MSKAIAQKSKPNDPAAPVALPEIPEAERVYVRRQWNHWEIGYVTLNDIDGLHWDTISGGVRSIAPRPFIHGYVSCTVLRGEIRHSCLHGEGPHRIKVCVVRKDNNPKIFKALKAIADLD